MNYVKILADGNIMPNGVLDYNKLKSYPASYDANLVLYYKFNDKNASNYVLDQTSNHNDGNLNSGADINAFGLWDTNAGFAEVVK